MAAQPEPDHGAGQSGVDVLGDLARHQAAMKAQRRGQLAGLAAAVLFGCSAPLIITLTGSGSALIIAMCR